MATKRDRRIESTLDSFVPHIKEKTSDALLLATDLSVRHSQVENCLRASANRKCSIFRQYDDFSALDRKSPAFLKETSAPGSFVVPKWPVSVDSNSLSFQSYSKGSDSDRKLFTDVTASNTVPKVNQLITMTARTFGNLEESVSQSTRDMSVMLTVMESVFPSLVPHMGKETASLPAPRFIEPETVHAMLSTMQETTRRLDNIPGS